MCVCVCVKEMLIMLTRLSYAQSTSTLSSKMPVFSLTSPSSLSRNVAITFSMSNLVNCKMLFVYSMLLTLSNCVINCHGAKDNLQVKSSYLLHAGDIGETFTGEAIDSPNSTPAPNGEQPTSTSPKKQDFNLHTLPVGQSISVGGSGVGAATTATGSASSRFNVDLRRSSVSSTGAIQSPTTFIGSTGLGSNPGRQQIRRKPHHHLSSLTAGKSTFDEKSM